MTLIMLWKEPEIERLWLVSDSRLSSPGPTGGRHMLSDHAAKILEAEVVLRQWVVGDALGTRDLSRTLGFAYAGASLVALQAYTAVLPLWSRLETMGRRALPTIRQCAEHVGIFLDGYSKEVGPDGECTCVLTGYDENSQSIEAWRLHAQGGALDVRQLPLSEPGAIEVIGSARQHAQEYLDRMRTASADPQWSREPLALIRQVLRLNERPDVGGGVQLGMVTEKGFELGFDAQPLAAGMPAGSPAFAMRFRGFDFMDISRVGEVSAGLRGFG